MKRNPQLTNAAIANASESTKRLNPGLFMGSVRTQKPQPDSRGALDGKEEGTRRSENGPFYRVTLIGVRRRFLDSDNAIGGAKSLRDAIAERLQLDDNERFIEWDYHQLKSSGEQGTIVVIQKL